MKFLSNITIVALLIIIAGKPAPLYSETPEEKQISTIDPKVAQFIKSLEAKKAPPLYTLPVQEARKVLLDVQKSGEAVKPTAADIQDITVPGGPKGRVSLRIIKPKNSKGLLPIIMYFYGGGWILGSKETHDRLFRDLANGANAAVVVTNYTPSPEAHYPVPLEQAYAATKYIADHGHQFNLDPTRLAVAGDSVGGNMATVVALLAQERGGPKIDFQLLLYPVTDASMSTESYQKFANGPWLTKKAMEWFWDAYAPDKNIRSKPTVSPLNAPLSQLKKLPPTLIITDENDVLRDEGEAYGHKLSQAGVHVVITRYLGTIHDFLLLNPLANTTATQAALDQAVNTLKKVFAPKKQKQSSRT